MNILCVLPRLVLCLPLGALSLLHTAAGTYTDQRGGRPGAQGPVAKLGQPLLEDVALGVQESLPTDVDGQWHQH